MANFVLYLSSGGESFNLISLRNKAGKEWFQRPDFESDVPAHLQAPLREAEACKTHQATLAFLKKIEQDSAFLSQVSLHHVNNDQYADHNSFKGGAHKETPSEMRSFIELRIAESTRCCVFPRILIPLHVKVALFIISLLAALAFFIVGGIVHEPIKRVIFLSLGGASLLTTIGSVAAPIV